MSVLIQIAIILTGLIPQIPNGTQRENYLKCDKKMDKETQARLRKKYGTQKFPEKKEYTREELEYFDKEQTKMDIEAIKRAKTNNEVLKRWKKK